MRKHVVYNYETVSIKLELGFANKSNKFGPYIILNDQMFNLMFILL